MSDYTNHDLAVLLCQAYGYPEYGAKQWLHSNKLDKTASGLPDVYWFLAQLGDNEYAVVLPGTQDLEQAFRDVDIVPERPVGDEFVTMGPIHRGFDEGVPQMISELCDVINVASLKSPGVQLVFTGHSLGAAHANLAYMRMKCMGFLITDEPVLFGEPHSTVYQPMHAQSWINGSDPVCGVPLWPYARRQFYHKMSVAPAAGDELGPWLGWHHMRLYEQGLRANVSQPR